MAAMPQYAPDKMRQNLVIGEPDEVIARLKGYEALATTSIRSGSTAACPIERKKKSLRAASSTR